MTPVVNSYIDFLEEDFSFISKTFKANVLSKIGQGVKDSVKGNRLNAPLLKKVLAPIPSVSQDKIDGFLAKYLPNFNHNKTIAKKYFDKKYPDKNTNDTVSSASALLTDANDKKSIQDSIKDVDRVYAMSGSGGGAFVGMLIGMFVIAGVFSLDDLEFKTKALATALGALLIISSLRSLGS